MMIRRCFAACCSVVWLGIALPASPADNQPADVRMPRYSDPLAGLYRAPATSVPRDVPLNAGHNAVTAALVPGANFHEVRKYMAALAQSAGDRSAYLQLQMVLARAVHIIKARYPSLQLASDLAAAEQQNVSLTLVLDMRTRIGTSASDTTGVQIDVVAFDDRHKPVARFIAEGKADTKSDGYGFPVAAQQALDALSIESKQYFN
jgi:hypothetical protein